MKRQVSFALLFIFLLSGFSYGQNKVLTNEELVIKAVSQSVADKIVSINSGSVVMNDDSKDISQTVSQGIIDAFKNNNFVVFLKNDQTVDYDAAYDILGFDFKYSNGKKRGFLKQRMIKRELAALLKLTLINHKSGEIKFSEDICVNYVDEIEPDYMKYVSSLKIKELSPVEPVSFAKRFAEPAILTTAIGALVVLFFSNR